MTDSAVECAAAILAALEKYYQATLELTGALERKEEEGNDGPVGIRARCIDEYGAAMNRWRAFAKVDRDPSVSDRIKWHHLRINQAETDVLRLVNAIKDEVRGEIVRLGTVRKVDRAYQSKDGGPIRILSSEG